MYGHVYVFYNACPVSFNTAISSTHLFNDAALFYTFSPHAHLNACRGIYDKGYS